MIGSGSDSGCGRKRFLRGASFLAAVLAGGVATASTSPLVCGQTSNDHVSGNHQLGGNRGSHHDDPNGHDEHAEHVHRHRASDEHHEAHHHPPRPANGDFVKQVGPRLKLHGNEFRFAGANNYYSAYKSELMVDDVLNTAVDQKFTVLRTWGFIDIGNQDGSNSTAAKADGTVYFHFFDGTAPGFNDGPDGLQHLDYVIFKAGQLGLRLVIPFTNNWSDFGGMDQYVRWAGGQFHDQFYTDPQIRRWYKDWISHLLEHKNFYTGVRLKDDPTIMTWELANEPRCGGGQVYPRSTTCTAETLTTWANEMSTYIKRFDHNHLVSVGDEGFYCQPDAPDPFDHCSDGVDTLALTALPNIDVMSYHLYPDNWGQTVDWGTQWIERHNADALALHKPAMLGEFGLIDKKHRNRNYKTWTDTEFDVGGSGALYWMLAAHQDNGTLYPDFDGFTVYCPGGVCDAYSNFSQMMTANRQLPFAPVADDDAADTLAEAPVTLEPLQNDVTYDAASLIPSSIDLDPTLSGQQTELSTPDGTFTAMSDGSVVFVAASGFAGDASASYTVTDSLGRSSEPARLTVTVAVGLGAPQLLYSFETGTDGWLAASFNAAGTTEQSSDFASAGSFGLKITPNPGGGWFGVALGTPLDLSGKTHVTFEMKTTASPSKIELGLQVGNSFTFCSGGLFRSIAADTTVTIDTDLTRLDCGAADLSQVHSFYVFLGNLGPDPIYVDNFRATGPLPVRTLYSFETDTQNFVSASFNAAGTTEQSSDFASNGSFSLKVTPNPGGGWFGVEYAPPIDLSAYTHAAIDVRTTTSGATVELAVRVGSQFTFCSGGRFPFLDANTTATINVNLTQLDCGTADLTQIHSVYAFLDAGSPVYLDNFQFFTPPPPLFSFEADTQGFAAASFNAAGTTEQSADFANEGSQGLKVTPNPGGGWFGVDFNTPLNLTGKRHLSWEVKTTSSPTSQQLELVVGSSSRFCKSNSRFIKANSVATMDVDLLTLDCAGPELDQVHSVYIFMGDGGPDPLYVDNITAR